MRKYLVIGAVMVFGGPALAQQPSSLRSLPNTTQLNVGNATVASSAITFKVQGAGERYDDTTPLGHAMNLCGPHRHNAGGNQPKDGGVNVKYDDGWESCNAVHQKWIDSGVADKAKDDADKAVIDKAGH